MRHVIISLVAVLAVLLQGVLVQGHVHSGAVVAAADTSATIVADASPDDDGSTPLAPSLTGCVFCQASQASGAFLAGAAPALDAPVFAAVRVQRPTPAPNRRGRTLAAARARAPPAASLSII